MLTTRPRLQALFTVLLVIVACGDTDPSDSPSDVLSQTLIATPATADTATPTVPPISVYEELLGIIPDTPETRSFVLINDYSLIRELFDVPLPGPGANQKEMDEYYGYMPPEWVEGFPDTLALGTTAFLSDGYSQWRSLL